MRKAINENPIAQIAVVGVLLLVVGFVVSTSVLKKDEGSSAPATDTTPTAADAANATAPSTAASAVPDTSATPTATGGTPTLPATEGPPLPRAVAAAYESGNAVALLVVRAGGVEDRMVRDAVESLRSVPGVSVFVTRAEGIAGYVRITQSVSVDRVPALVIVRPRWATGGVPQATVDYGFRSSRSVVQAVKDALYQGRTVPYHPG